MMWVLYCTQGEQKFHRSCEYTVLILCIIQVQSVDVHQKICSSQSNVFSGKHSCIFLPLPRNNVNYYVVYLKDVSCSRFRIGGSEELWGTVGHRYPRPVVRTPGDGAILYIVNINIFQQCFKRPNINLSFINRAKEILVSLFSCLFQTLFA